MYVHAHTHKQTNRVQWDALRSLLYVQSLPGKREGSSSWQAHCSRSIQVCFYCRLWTPPLHCVILSFTELCSFVVHLLCCVGSINLISSLFSPITNSRLSIARSSTVCRLVLSSYCLSNIIRQAHLWAGRTDLMGKHVIYKENQIYIHTLHMRQRFETIQDCAQMHRYTCDTLPPEPARSRKHTQMV